VGGARSVEGHANEGGPVLEDAIDRLRGLNDRLEGSAITRALVAELPGRDDDSGLLEGRTDTLITDLRDDLVDLIVQPHQLTRAGRTSVAAERRARHGRLSFNEGYLIGRVGLDTHRVALRWSSTRHTVRLGVLRSLVLHPRLTAAYSATTRLAPLVRDLTDQTRGLPADQAAQFAGFGVLSAIAEWTVVVGSPGPRAEPVLAAC
jgi:hypothetical protein